MSKKDTRYPVKMINLGVHNIFEIKKGSMADLKYGVQLGDLVKKVSSNLKFSHTHFI